MFYGAVVSFGGPAAAPPAPNTVQPCSRRNRCRPAGPQVWDPVMIVGQIVSVQCLFYITLGLWQTVLVGEAQRARTRTPLPLPPSASPRLWHAPRCPLIPPLAPRAAGPLVRHLTISFMLDWRTLNVESRLGWMTLLSHLLNAPVAAIMLMWIVGPRRRPCRPSVLEPLPLPWRPGRRRPGARRAPPCWSGPAPPPAAAGRARQEGAGLCLHLLPSAPGGGLLLQRLPQQRLLVGCWPAPALHWQPGCLGADAQPAPQGPVLRRTACARQRCVASRRAITRLCSTASGAEVLAAPLERREPTAPAPGRRPLRLPPPPPPPWAGGPRRWWRC
jgi:hypothetical protein